MSKQVHKITLHGMLLMTVFWFAVGTYVVFMVTTLIEHGWADSEATGAITIMAVVTILMQPFYGYISDKFKSEKKIAVSLLSLAGICFAMMPYSLQTGNKIIILLNMAGVTLTGMQVGGLIDAWIVGLKQEYESINYGLIRGCGSFSFALSAQIMGIVTVAHGHSIRFWMGGCAIALAAILAATFRSARRDRLPGDEDRPEQRLSGLAAFRLVFSSKKYNLLLLVSFFLLLTISAIMTLTQLLIRDFNGTTAQVGTASAVAAVSEVPVMFLMAVILKKIGFKKIILACSAFFVVRMFITASVTTVDTLIYVQVFHGLTYAVLLPVSMNYLSQILDERVRSTAVMVYAAATASLTGVLGNLIITTLLAAGHTAQTALFLFAFSALIGFILTVYGMMRKIW